MIRARRRYSSVSATVDLEDVFSEIDDDDLKEEYRERFGGEGAVDFDLLGEIEWHLLRGGVQDALALISSAQRASQVSDDMRQRQFQQQGLSQ